MLKKPSTKPGSALDKAAGPRASESRDLAGLFSALESCPGVAETLDAVTLLALADWFEEREKTRESGCLRWVAAMEKMPYQHRHSDDLLHHHDTWNDGWFWWTTDREKGGWGYAPSAILPHALWDRLTHQFNYDPLVFKEYPTVRAALEALLEAWSPALVATPRKSTSKKKTT